MRSSEVIYTSRKRENNLRQDFAVSSYTFIRGHQILKNIVFTPFAECSQCSLCRVFTPPALHRWSKSTWRNVQVPTRAVPFSRVSSRGHWALLCCNWKIKLVINSCVLGHMNQSKPWRNKSGGFVLILGSVHTVFLSYNWHFRLL